MIRRGGPVDEKNLTGKDQQGIDVFPAEDSKPAWLRFEFSEPYEARQITFYIAAVAKEPTISGPIEFGERTSVALEASDDGNQYRISYQYKYRAWKQS